jgi:thioredoxin
MDVTTETFEQDVIERSRDVPVVVDFWAGWCRPCLTLGPVLERETGARSGKVELAKVDVDANQELAARYDVRGIPAVKAFRNGSVVREFAGALPPAAVAEFLDELTGPTATEQLVAELRASGELPAVADALEQADHERAFELLLDEAAAADDGRLDWLRDRIVRLFGDLGHEHPLVGTYRRRLATILY